MLRWRGQAGRLVDSIPARLVLLAAVAGIPVVVMASMVVWQNYRFAEGMAPKQALLLRSEALARTDALVTDALATLRAADDAAPAAVAGCQDFGANLVATRSGEFTFVSRDTVRPREAPCFVPGAVVLPAGLPYVLRSAPDATLLAITEPGNGSTLVAGLARSRFTQAHWTAAGTDAPVWLDDGVRLVPIAGRFEGAAPSPALRAAMLEQGAILEGIAANGEPYVYGASRIAGNLSVVVGLRARDALVRARHVLLQRMVELAVLLLVGLSALVLGADLAVVQPLRRLGRAVGGWRETGSFAVLPPTGLPAELAELWDSFSRATASLRQREAELQQAVVAQELAMQEIHHRVKNNLQIVASLLNLQASRIQQPEARAEFQSARDRVRALATLHRHLYAHGELHTITMRSFLVELCDQLFQAMGEKAGGRIALSIEAPELQMLSDQAVPLALIVTEAVTNAVKYAFPGGRRGRIDVALTERDGQAELVIEDDGVGIPAGRAETETGTRDGIGLRLIHGFARQLGGTLEVREGEGTRYAVRMTLHHTRTPETA